MADYRDSDLPQFFYFPADRCNPNLLWLHKFNPANERRRASRANHRTKAAGTPPAFQQTAECFHRRTALAVRSGQPQFFSGEA
jgi:hypothetical protein